MSFFRTVFILTFIFLANTSFADEAAQKQKVLDQTKEIAIQLQEDEDVPLNDPFAGNAATGGAIALPSVSKEEKEQRESLYDYKLVGIISGEYENYVSLVNTSGDIRTVALYEELKKGLKLIDIRLSEAIFQNGEKYLIINFNSEIEEKDEY